MNRAEEDLVVLDSFAALTYKIKRAAFGGLNETSPDLGKIRDDLINSAESGVYNMVEDKFRNDAYRGGVLSALEERGITAVTYFSRGYPERLKDIPSPPLVLYCMGNVGLLSEKMFAVVGSRRTPPAAVGYCAQAAEELSCRFVVVTGFADGADSAAAEGALKNGRAVCVLAYGTDYVYPAVNAALFAKVRRGGLIVTEHRPDVQPRKYLFPPRNRIIAGLSEGALVVSAGVKSGALITAEYAKKYDREVFAFPYSIGSAYGAGCNALIKGGARLAESGGDVLAYYGLESRSAVAPGFTEAEKRILGIISGLGEAHVEEIAARAGVIPFQLKGELTSLEIKRAVYRQGGNRYAALISLEEE